MEISFRPLARDDLPQLHDWLQRDHVARWWREHRTLEEVVSHYGRSIEGDEPTDHYVVLVDGRAAGMIQTYLVSDYPEYARAVGTGPGVAGVDLLIGEEDLLGRGVGTEVRRSFVRDIVFARADVVACIAGPEPANVASIRAFEKAGFVRGRLVDVPGGPPELLMRLDGGPARAG